MTVSAEAYDSLLRFLYRAPIGLVQAALAGDIEMINPTGANLMMPLSPDGSLDNLFTVLEGVAPELGRLVADADGSSDVICESLRIPLPSVAGETRGPRVLSLGLFRLDAARLMAVLVDATLEARRERNDLSRGLEAAARLDGLTGLPNRLAVIERLRRVMARAPSEVGYHFALFYMSCDRFKEVNDSFGLSAGDELLGLLADRLRSTLPALRALDPGAGGDARMAAHIGGDEFVVLLEDWPRTDDMRAVARSLTDVLTKPYDIGPNQIYCSLSVGCVLRQPEGGDADAVLQEASLAMAEAKRAGDGRCVVFEPAMHSRATQRATLEADLRRALTEDQFFVVYQPVVGLQETPCSKSGIDRFAGVEALVRWRHPTRGVVPPLALSGSPRNVA